MKAFMTILKIKTKMDFRSSDILITNYLVPILFFLVMGAVFTSIMPETKNTLIASMIVFSTTMGATIGVSASVNELFTQDIRKTLVVSKVSFLKLIFSSILSGIFHLLIVSTIIILVAPILFDATSISNVFIFYGRIIISTFTIVLVGVIIGLLSKNTAQLTILAQLIFLPSMMLSGIMFDASLLPAILENVGKLLPATQSFLLLTSSDTYIASYGPLLIMALVFILLIAVLLQRLRTLERQ